MLEALRPKDLTTPAALPETKPQKTSEAINLKSPETLNPEPQLSYVTLNWARQETSETPNSELP